MGPWRRHHADLVVPTASVTSEIALAIHPRLVTSHILSPISRIQLRNRQCECIILTTVYANIRIAGDAILILFVPADAYVVGAFLVTLLILCFVLLAKTHKFMRIYPPFFHHLKSIPRQQLETTSIAATQRKTAQAQTKAQRSQQCQSQKQQHQFWLREWW